MFKFLFLFVSLSSVFVKNVNAETIFYRDDEKFEQCSRFEQNLDVCMKEQIGRTQKDVQNLYKAILRTDTIRGWNKDVTESTQIMKDMYSSWLAYRTRLCSLAKVSEKNTAPLFDPELSCKTYHTYHHKNQLHNVLYLLNINKPISQYKSQISNAIGPDFLAEIPHDQEYEECNKIKSKERCYYDELNRLTDKIKDLYQKFYDSEDTAKWNNGVSLQQGNYRDTFDSWVAYRNRLCSLYVHAKKIAGKDKEFKLNDCIIYMNKEKADTFENLFAHSIGVMDGESYDPSDTDGGETEGKKIIPLKEKVAQNIKGGELKHELSLGKQNIISDDNLSKTNSSSKKQNLGKNSKSKKRTIPSWAKQN